MTQSPIIILGANGQVGKSLSSLLGKDALSFTKETLNISNTDRIRELLTSTTPKALINASAYTNVEQAEEEKALATEINVNAVASLANICAELDTPLVHFSTDYVFDGTKKQAWTEEDVCAPLNHYGRSKRDGELAIESSGANYLIFRTSWVYDHCHHNFLTTMLSLAKERSELSVVCDQIGTPTYALDLAKITIDILNQALRRKPFPSGIYHLCSKGSVSWHEFAKTIFEYYEKNGRKLALETLKAIPSDAYPTKAKRPLNSKLDCSKVDSEFTIKGPTCQQGLDDCLKLYQKN